MNEKQNSHTQESWEDDKDKFFVPIPENQKKLLENPKCNFSLLSPRIVGWKKDKDGLKVNDQVMDRILTKGNSSLKNIRSLLQKKHSWQKDYLESIEKSGGKAATIRATLTGPFITGLGAGHPTETGMILDRNLGTPYIPASSIKGVLRLACAINIARKEGKTEVSDAHPQLVKFFGSADTSQGSRGQVMFLDAYPERDVELQLDIMNPHYGKYYSGENKQPMETESPVPIKFISVPAGTVFVFRAVCLPLADGAFTDDEVKALKDAFDTAFEVVGFGGKTAIGYGRFTRSSGGQKPAVGSVAPAPAKKELEIGEYEAVVEDKDKKKLRVTFKIKQNGVEATAIRMPCEKKIFDKLKKKDKVTVKIDGKKDYEGNYVVVKII